MDLAKACARAITRSIITDIGNNVFVVLVDESRDVSVKEQMGVVLRYLNKEGRLLERFLGLKRMSDTTYSSLKKSVEQLFVKHCLYLSKLRGQGYDGASNMRDEFNGLKSLLLQDYPSVFYVHCFSHQLQLVPVTVAKNIPVVGDFFAYVTMIVNMAGVSCRRREQVREKEKERIHVALEGGNLLSGKVIEVLGEIYDHGIISDQRGLASSLIDKMESYQFVFVLRLMKNLLRITNELSLVLQNRYQNIVNALVLIKSVKSRLQEFMTDGWGIILNEVNMFCELHKIRVLDMTENMTTNGYGKRRGQVITNYHHFCFDVLNEVVNMLLQEMNDRFSEDLGSLALKLVETENHKVFPLVYRLIELALVLPVATASVERMFSAMKIVKTDLRNKMIDELMNDSLVVYIENETFATIENEAILLQFQKLKTYRTQLPSLARMS